MSDEKMTKLFADIDTSTEELRSLITAYQVLAYFINLQKGKNLSFVSKAMIINTASCLLRDSKNSHLIDKAEKLIVNITNEEKNKNINIDLFAAQYFINAILRKQYGYEVVFDVNKKNSIGQLYFRYVHLLTLT